MYWKIIGYVLAGLLGLALIIGVGIKITQKAEGYKAETQTFYTFEPHYLFGCARYEAFKKSTEGVKSVSKPVSVVNSSPVK